MAHAILVAVKLERRQLHVAAPLHVATTESALARHGRRTSPLSLEPRRGELSTLGGSESERSLRALLVLLLCVTDTVRAAAISKRRGKRCKSHSRGACNVEAPWMRKTMKNKPKKMNPNGPFRGVLCVWMCYATWMLPRLPRGRRVSARGRGAPKRFGLPSSALSSAVSACFRFLRLLTLRCAVSDSRSRHTQTAALGRTQMQVGAFCG